MKKCKSCGKMMPATAFPKGGSVCKACAAKAVKKK